MVAIMSSRRIRLSFRLSPALAASAALYLTACASLGSGQGMLPAATTFTGMSKEALLSCAGEPQRTETVGDIERLTYLSEGVTNVPTQNVIAPELGFRVPWDGSPYGLGAGYGGYGSDPLSCAATFTLRNGVVQQLIFSGASGQGRCYPIIGTCLALLRPEAGQVAPAGQGGAPSPSESRTASPR